MIAIKSMEVRKNFRDICASVFGGQTIIISRPKNENVVMMSEKEYESLLRERQNREYLERLDRSWEQIAAGDVVKKSLKELRDVE